MPDQAKPSSPVLWLVIGIMSFVSVPVMLVVPGLLAGPPPEREGTRISITTPDCRPTSEWPAGGWLLVNEQAAVPSREVRAAVTVTANAEPTSAMSPLDGARVRNSNGFFFAVASIDLTGVDPGAEICIDASGLADRLEAGDLYLARPLASGPGPGMGLYVLAGIAIVFGIGCTAAAASGFSKGAVKAGG
jgi:hypothetical protein